MKRAWLEVGQYGFSTVWHSEQRPSCPSLRAALLGAISNLGKSRLDGRVGLTLVRYKLRRVGSEEMGAVDTDRLCNNFDCLKEGNLKEKAGEREPF